MIRTIWHASLSSKSNYVFLQWFQQKSLLLIPAKVFRDNCFFRKIVALGELISFQDDAVRVQSITTWLREGFHDPDESNSYKSNVMPNIYTIYLAIRTRKFIKKLNIYKHFLINHCKLFYTYHMNTLYFIFFLLSLSQRCKKNINIGFIFFIEHCVIKKRLYYISFSYF